MTTFANGKALRTCGRSLGFQRSVRPGYRHRLGSSRLVVLQSHAGLHSAPCAYNSTSALARHCLSYTCATLYVKQSNSSRLPSRSVRYELFLTVDGLIMVLGSYECPIPALDLLRQCILSHCHCYQMNWPHDQRSGRAQQRSHRLTGRTGGVKRSKNGRQRCRKEHRTHCDAQNPSDRETWCGFCLPM